MIGGVRRQVLQFFMRKKAAQRYFQDTAKQHMTDVP
jgi:hypothetical protein